MERLVEKADVLILAGDIHVSFARTNKAVSYFAKHYELVLFVPGNHEFYGFSIDEFSNRKFTAPNAHILNPGTFKHENITFIGATLWTNFQEDPIVEMYAKTHISDFSRIRNFKPNDAKNLYYRDLSFIKEHSPGKKVIITHFLPANECTHPKYGQSILNKYFANNLASYIEQLKDVTWLFGHTHDEVNIQLGSTRLLANPLGYPGERKDYKPLLIDLP